MFGVILIVVVVGIIVIIRTIDKQRDELLHEILKELNLEGIESELVEYDDYVTVKSRQTLNNYSDKKYFRERNNLERVSRQATRQEDIRRRLDTFLRSNTYEGRPQYNYVRDQLSKYTYWASGYKILVTYISTAGNNLGERKLFISNNSINNLINNPEFYMTKGEFNKLTKQQTKEKLEKKKHSLYDQVNSIIDYANESKKGLTIKTKEKDLDELVQKLFEKTVNSIQKISKLESDEWSMIRKYILSIENQIREIGRNDKKISAYYESQEFGKIKETCQLLSQSQKEFNEYIDEKAQSISKLFGTRIVRNETQNEDVYNYIRVYKKSISPFTAEVSSSVFGSAENNPIGYIIKYFYPNKSQYKLQIERLKVLIEELETLKEAKVIIDNYKKDYDQYIQNVPSYVLENDESGFYSRLGLTIIDESILNVEYRFTYTSDGGMAQRSFTVPMNEENIIELIDRLESKLSLDALAKEQRAMMTARLRKVIKERDNYTCCQCGNSVHVEPNLLLEIDHIIPISRGGLTKEDNLQTLCWKCNRNKGAKLIY